MQVNYAKVPLVKSIHTIALSSLTTLRKSTLVNDDSIYFYQCITTTLNVNVSVLLYIVFQIDHFNFAFRLILCKCQYKFLLIWGWRNGG